MQGIEPRSPGWNASADHYTIQTFLSEGVEFNQLTNSSQPKIEMINIGNKILPIIIGPYITQWKLLLLVKVK